MALTQKQEKFVQALIAGKSQREAYKEAYNATGMTDKTIDEKACKLLAGDKVRARYEELQAAVREEGEKHAVATAVEVLEELTANGLGQKEYPAYDMFGNERQHKPSMTVRLKALELLGKKHKLWSDSEINSVPVSVVVKYDYGDTD